MRISDWSSDVCSSDLIGPAQRADRQRKVRTMPEFEENHKPPADRAPQAASAELGPFAIPPVPLELLVSPLDYLYAENCRILRLCAALDMVAADPGRVGHLAAPALIDFLRTDFPSHLDEMAKIGRA